MKRITEIDVLQGFAMLLVVLGHSLPISGYNILSEIRLNIYCFHMALFIFISGFLIRYSYREITSVSDYLKYAGKRFKKFGIPFLSIGTLIILMTALDRKYSFQETLNAEWNLFIRPCQSDAGFLWYIYLLFFIYLLSPLIFEFFKGWLRIIPYMLGGYIVIFPFDTGLLVLNHFSHFFIFYLLGVTTAENIEKLKRIPHRWYWSALIPFIIWNFYFFRYSSESFSYIAGLCAIPFFCVFALAVQRVVQISNIFVWISKNCFIIYLLHMFVIQAGLLILPRIGITGYIGQIVMLFVIVPLGLILPVYCEYVFKKILTFSNSKKVSV